MKETVLMKGAAAVPQSEEKSIKKLMRSRGFDENGFYKFEEIESRPIGNREPGNINNEYVSGYFTTAIEEPIVLKRNEFLANSWKRICSCMGFPYNNSDEIDSFKITEDCITVFVDVKTPEEFNIDKLKCEGNSSIIKEITSTKSSDNPDWN